MTKFIELTDDHGKFLFGKNGLCIRHPRGPDDKCRIYFREESWSVQEPYSKIKAMLMGGGEQSQDAEVKRLREAVDYAIAALDICDEGDFAAMDARKILTQALKQEGE